MPRRIARILLLCVGVAGLGAADLRAADITWQAPLTISGTADQVMIGVEETALIIFR
jgi:lipid-binding SYLF domain-containing protein